MKHLEYVRFSDKVVSDMGLVQKLIDYKKNIQNQLSVLILPSEVDNLRNSIKDYGILDTVVFLTDMQIMQAINPDDLEIYLASRASCEILKELDFNEYNNIEGCVSFSDKLEQFRIKSDEEKKSWFLNKFNKHI